MDGTSKKYLLDLPRDVQRMIGYSLNLAQRGKEDIDCKILKGFGGASVREIKKDDPGGTYRAIFTIKFKDILYVLHVFQKKSKTGMQTPKAHLDLVNKRLKEVQDLQKDQENEKKETAQKGDRLRNRK